MKVILLKDIPKVGRKYDIKDIAEGYAVNMLIPKGLVRAATKSAIAEVEKVKSNDLASKQIQNELLLKNLEVIKNLTIAVKEKANDKGHLFAGITREVLAEEIFKSARLKVDPESIKINKPIKEVGEHIIKLEILDKKAEFKLVVEAK